jgi:hypothetical protein
MQICSHALVLKDVPVPVRIWSPVNVFGFAVEFESPRSRRELMPLGFVSKLIFDVPGVSAMLGR